MNDFEPYKIFQLIDRGNQQQEKGWIDAADLQQFLEHHYIQAKENELEELIAEFDSDEDGRLSFDEFQMMMLPSTNLNLRTIAQMRKNSMLLVDQKASYEVESMVARLVNREMEYHKKRESNRRALLKCEDFNKYTGFEAMAGDHSEITVKDMINFFD